MCLIGQGKGLTLWFLLLCSMSSCTLFFLWLVFKIMLKGGCIFFCYVRYVVPATWVSLVRQSSSAFLLKTRCLWKHSSSTDNERHVMVLSREVIRSLKTPATLYLIHTRVSPSPMANHLKFMQMNTRSLEEVRQSELWFTHNSNSGREFLSTDRFPLQLWFWVLRDSEVKSFLLLTFASQ